MLVHPLEWATVALSLSARWREKLLALGAYPDVSLKRAREKRDDARKLVADEVDPNAKRQAERMAQADTFEAIGVECSIFRRRNSWRRPHGSSRQARHLSISVLGRSSDFSNYRPGIVGVLRRIEAREE